MYAGEDGGDEAGLFGKRFDYGFEAVSNCAFFIDFRLEGGEYGRIDMRCGGSHFLEVGENELEILSEISRSRRRCLSFCYNYRPNR